MLQSTGEKVQSAIEFNVPDEVLTERICGRWIHKASGRSYHVKFNPPKSYDGKADATTDNMKDDETGEALMQRPDDTKDALPKRLEAYHNDTEPILGHYASSAACAVSRVNANQSMSAVWSEVASALNIP